MPRTGRSGRTGDVLSVLSPAKSLDFDSPLGTGRHTEPVLADRAAQLVGILGAKTPEDLEHLMSISPDLAELNFARFADWRRDVTPEVGRQAILAFAGDTYRGLRAASFTTRDLTRAQKTLRILSGLYGVLRPLDLIQPYRLEMGTKLHTDAGDTLYEFWGDTITDVLAADLASSPGTGALVNLASKEYFSAVDVDRLGATVVTPTFLDVTGSGDLRVVGMFAKQARGAMARWIVTERIQTVKALSGFDDLGYRFDPSRSEPEVPVFVRRAADR